MCTHPTPWSTKPVHSHPPFSWLASGASVDACARRRTVDIKRGSRDTWDEEIGVNRDGDGATGEEEWSV